MSWPTSRVAAGRMEIPGMPGIGVQAGVVAGSDIYAQPATPTKMSMSLQYPGTWTNIIVIGAMAYLVAVYIGALRISGE